MTLLTWKIKACSLPYTGTLVGSRKYTTIHLESSDWYFFIKVVYVLHVGSEIFHDTWGVT